MFFAACSASNESVAVSLETCSSEAAYASQTERASASNCARWTTSADGSRPARSRALTECQCSSAREQATSLVRSLAELSGSGKSISASSLSARASDSSKMLRGCKVVVTPNVHSHRRARYWTLEYVRQLRAHPGGACSLMANAGSRSPRIRVVTGTEQTPRAETEQTPRAEKV